MTPGPVVRSVSGTWHRTSFAEAYATLDSERKTHLRTECHRLVKPGKVIHDWDGRQWPGVRICTDCRWHG